MAQRGRPTVQITLSDAERETLQRWSRRHSSAQALALRSRVVLASSDQSMCPAGRRSVVKMPLGRESGLRPEQGSAPWPGPRARRVLGPPWTVPGLLRWEAWLAATS